MVRFRFSAQDAGRAAVLAHHVGVDDVASAAIARIACALTAVYPTAFTTLGGAAHSLPICIPHKAVFSTKARCAPPGDVRVGQGGSYRRSQSTSMLAGHKRTKTVCTHVCSRDLTVKVLVVFMGCVGRMPDATLATGLCRIWHCMDEK